MKMQLNAHFKLCSTDYWSVPEGAASGWGWLILGGSRWHVVMPAPPVCSLPDNPLHRATIMPCVDTRTPEGWAWQLMLRVDQGAQPPMAMRVRIPPACVLGVPPRLPMPGTMNRQEVFIYTHEVGHAGTVYPVSAGERMPELVRAFSSRLYITRAKGDPQGNWRLHDQVWFTKKPQAIE